MKIVGYESRRGQAACTWGAAAILDGNKLINAVSGLGSNDGQDKLDEYVERKLAEPSVQRACFKRSATVRFN